MYFLDVGMKGLIVKCAAHQCCFCFCFQIGCVIAASFIQYLFQVVFCWMLIEGIHLYRKATSVFAVHFNMTLCYLFAWGRFSAAHASLWLWFLRQRGNTLFCYTVTSILSKRLLHKMTNSRQFSQLVFTFVFTPKFQKYILPTFLRRNV